MIITNKDNVIDFKQSFKKLELSKETKNIINKNNINIKDIVIGEFSGRDSAAAIIKAMENENINIVLPIVAFTGTDYGDLDIFYKNWNVTNKRINDLYNNNSNNNSNKTLLPLHFIFEPTLWSILNGRFAVMLFKKYNYYSPCISCHFYFRIVRIPIAKQLGNKIICGERINHDNSFKIDQFKEAIELYHKLCNNFNVKLISPIKNIKNGEEIKEIISYKWEQGENQFSCVFSGNYKDKNGEVLFDKESIINILNNFTYPSCCEILKNGYKNNFDYFNIVKKFIE